MSDSVDFIARRCPYAEECGYHGVFLGLESFQEHMEKFHGQPEKEHHEKFHSGVMAT